MKLLAPKEALFDINACSHSTTSPGSLVSVGSLDSLVSQFLVSIGSLASIGLPL